MSLITNEYNYQRKAHRVDLPLIAEINGEQYSVEEWSIGGIGVEGFSIDSVENRDTFPAHIILPMPDSVISLRVSLGFVSQHGDKTGLAFINLNPKHRRVLRHYIELSIEGKLDNLEDIVGIVSSPQIATPIQDALNLSDLEEESLVRKFRQRSFLSILLAILFLGGAAGVIFYNTMYRINTTGLISGTIRPISAGCTGIITEIFVAAGDHVKQGQKLFTIEKEKGYVAANRQESDIADIKNKLDFYASTPVQQNTSLLHDLQADYKENLRIYDEAKLLFKEGGITRKDLYLAKSYSLRAKVAYDRFRDTYTDRYNQQQAEIQSLTKKLTRLENELSNQVVEETLCLGTSPIDGEIYKGDKRVGDYTKASDIIGLLHVDSTPNVLIKLHSSDALKIDVGMEAFVYVPSLKTKYEARISGIGYSAVSGIPSLTLEASLDETLIKLDFVDPAVRFPVNSRVAVWIKTFNYRRVLL